MKSVPPPLPILFCRRCERRPATRGSYSDECSSSPHHQFAPRHPWDVVRKRA